MSRESAAAFKLPENEGVPEFKELPANDDFEIPTAANDNFEHAPEAPIEIDDDRIDEIKERLGLKTAEIPDIETYAANDDTPENHPMESLAGGTPEGPDDGDGGGNDDNGGDGSNDSSGGHGGGINKVERVQQALHKPGHNVDWMNKWPGKGLIYFLAYIVFPVFDFIKNTNWGDAFKTKGGGGGGGGGSHGGGGHGGGGGHH